MDMFTPAMFAQLVVAASVAYVMHITFFKPAAAPKPAGRQPARAKSVVRQRSERWAA